MTDKDGELYWNGVKLTKASTSGCKAVDAGDALSELEQSLMDLNTSGLEQLDAIQKRVAEDIGSTGLASDPWSELDAYYRAGAAAGRASQAVAKLTKVPTELGRQYVQPITCDERGYRAGLTLAILDGFEPTKVKAMTPGGRFIVSMWWEESRKEFQGITMELVKHSARHATLHITSRQPESWSVQVEYREAGKPVTKTMRSTDTVALTPQYVSVLPPPDPLDKVIDGWTLRDLVGKDHDMQRHDDCPRRLTPAQRAAVSAHWSAQLRRRVEASRAVAAESEPSVRYCEVEPWE